MHQVSQPRVLFCTSVMAECVATTSTCAAKPKHKRTILSIEDKVAIIKQLKGSSARVIAERYGVAKGTISDIKKNRDKILRFKQMCDMGMSKKQKLMKLGDDVQHDKGVYLWFKQKRMEGVPEVKMNKNLYANFRSYDTAWMKTRSITG